MKTERPALPTVNSFDLGPIQAAQVGDEVALVWVGGSSCWTDSVLRVTEVIDDTIRCGAAGVFHRTGKTKIHIYGPLFYISASAEIIGLAKKYQEQCAGLWAQAEAARRARLAQSLSIAEELFDDSEMVNSLASTLADRFTAEQLSTFSGWLQPATTPRA
ncbi:MAG TPA: hypothetical protein VGD81_03255 [Opitutaceae bacterium]